jgi:Uma2 family endonuclease
MRHERYPHVRERDLAMPRQSVTTTARPESSLPFAEAAAPTWEIAYLFPAQGQWTETDYLNLDGLHSGFPLLELSAGRLEVLPMPTELHQLILYCFAKLLEAHSQQHAPGVILPSGMRIRLAKGQFRDPDVVYMKAANAARRHNEFWDGADLVMEVVSAGAKDRERDWEIKPREYARAGIPEYWIVDPERQLIRVLTLRGRNYRLHSDFGPGERASSVLLPGFEVDVAALLAPDARGGA